jgi:hypothetical protein
MGMQGQGQTEATALRVGTIRLRNLPLPLSSLYVIDRLTKAAKGKGSVAGESSSVYREFRILSI